MTTQEEIPEEVLEWLEIARDDGSFNMLDRGSVIDLIEELADSYVNHANSIVEKGFDAVDWLRAFPNSYMTALIAMGERRSLDNADD